MSQNREKPTWDKIVAITGIIGLIIGSILSGFSLYEISQNQSESARLQEQSNNLTEQANNLTQASLQLQNMTSNFNPIIIDYMITANLHDVYYGNGSNSGNGKMLDDDGSLNMSLVVITPHASIISFVDIPLNFTAMNPNGSNDTLIDPNNAEETYASIFPYLPLVPGGNNYYGYPVEAFVQPGVSQINFTMPISASFVLNPLLTNNTIMLGVPIGSINIALSMLDVQARSNSLWDFTAPLLVNFNSYYGENFQNFNGTIIIG
jgi:hypothetical protein